MISRSFYTKGIQTTIQDVGYYAPFGRNLSKSCVPCTFEFLISASPHPKLTTLGISLGGQPVKHRQLARQVGERVEDPPASSMASFKFTRSVPFQGTTFIFGSWVCIADGVGNFWRFLVDMKPKISAAESATCQPVLLQQRSRWSLLQARLVPALQQLPLGWTRSNLGIRIADPNSVHANQPLISKRPTSLGPSPC
jgi:hypothetical protein